MRPFEVRFGRADSDEARLVGAQDILFDEGTVCAAGYDGGHKRVREIAVADVVPFCGQLFSGSIKAPGPGNVAGIVMIRFHDIVGRLYNRMELPTGSVTI